MKVLFNNDLESATISATSENINYPVKNIVDPFLRARFQSLGNSSVITYEFDSNKCMSSFFLAHHNINCYKLVLIDWADNVLYTEENHSVEDIESTHFNTVQNVRKIELTICKIETLIAEDTVNTTKFDTATYIPINGTGIYPAYENAFRDAISLVDIPAYDLNAGTFTINTATISSYDIPITTLTQDDNYTTYFTSSVELEKVEVIEIGGDSTVRYVNNSPSTSFDFNILIDDANNTQFKFTPKTGDLSTDVNITMLTIPKSYPKVQSWGGSQLTTTLSNVKSISFSLSDWDALFDGFISAPPILEVDGLEVLQFRPNSTIEQLNGQLAINKGVSGGDFNTTIDQINSDVITLSDDGINIYFYKNKTLIKTALSTDWRISEVTFNARSEEDSLTFTLSQLITSPQESIGYPKGTIFNYSSLDNVYLGGTGSGCCYDMPEVMAEYTPGFLDNSSSVESSFGQTQQNYIEPLRVLAYSFSGISPTTAKLIANEYKAIGIGKPVYIDLYENNHTKEAPIYAKITEALSFPYSPSKSQFNLEIQECR